MAKKNKRYKYKFGIVARFLLPWFFFFAGFTPIPKKQASQVAVCKPAKERIKIDGKLDEPSWRIFERLPLSSNKTGHSIADSSYTTYVQLAYDSSYVYFAFTCHDKNIFNHYTHRDEHLWKDEVIEIFIDLDDGKSTYVEFELSPANVQFDSYITDTLDIDINQTSRYNILGIRSAVHIQGTVNDETDQDNLWTAEIAFPIEELDLELDREYPINFYRIDRDKHGPGPLAWSPTFRRFHCPSSFGKIMFY
ncbi:MAG: carbohydrate-binding family 9-like protein [Reichenbachiella sp.]|uniref:carbohydrate-binding family 9-like protein n=1 Tax=Reichenbachiella sp. TaxID=2184521 RepID=UPI003298531B